MLRMKDRTVIVTGSARGLGAATAQVLAEEGAAVIICDLLEPEGEATAEQLRTAGHRVLFQKLDVTDEADWAAMVARVKDWAGKVDGLVNNAGIVNRTGITGTPRANWERIVAINLTGTFLGIQAVAPAIRDAGGGSIVSVSSVAAFVGHNDVGYSATKAGILGITRTAAAEYADWNIRVNAVCPGIMVSNLNAGGAHLEPWRRATPIGRHGKLVETARAITFLLSDEASFVTGAELAVDGGFLAAGSARRISLEAGIDLTAPPQP